MKKLIIIFFVFGATSLIAQNNTIQNNGVIECVHEEFECGYTAEMSAQSWNELRPIRDKYSAQLNTRAMASPPVLSWPLKPSVDVYAPGYYVMSNQVDLDPTGGVLDYNGGSRTYNGHSGIDIRIWPFYWTMMDNNLVEVVAAAAGTIINKVDGNFDRSCSSGGSSNRVDILHDGGYSTLYLHLKSGSLTSKSIGDYVSKGEFLGIVGSSGSSTNPHLHFQVMDDMGNAVEPYAGPSNPTLPSSLWDVQKPYLESSIVRLMTHSAAPSLNNCPTSTDTPNERNHFSQGNSIRFGTYFMAPQSGHVANYTVRNPSGSLVWSWTTNFNSTFTRNAQNYFTPVLPANAPSGTWEFRVSFSGNGQIASHHFTVGCTANYVLSVNHGDDDGYIASNSIESTSTVGSTDDRVHYEAGNFILLNPGFSALAGCSFRTRIDNCVVGGQ